MEKKNLLCWSGKVILLLFFLFLYFFCIPIVSKDKSLEPLIRENSLLIVFLTKNVKIGDIVVFYFGKVKLIKIVRKVRDNEIWVEGLHPKSFDSKKFGWVKKEKILGKVILVIPCGKRWWHFCTF